MGGKEKIGECEEKERERTIFERRISIKIYETSSRPGFKRIHTLIYTDKYLLLTQLNFQSLLK